MELRDFTNFEIREDDSGDRILEGIAVPYGETYDTGYGFRERFEAGAFADGDGVGQPLYVEHGHMRGDLPIGIITAAEDRTEGRFIRAKISATARGNEAYTLLRDGVIRKFSVGFESLAHRMEEDGTTVRTSASTVEVSLTGNPAYKTADVTGVRSTTANQIQEDPMTDTTTADTEIRSQLEDAERRLAVLEANPRGGSGDFEPLPFRNMAEYLRGLADGTGRQHVERMNEAFRSAAERFEARAYSGEVASDTTSNVVPTWVDREIKLVDKGRRILNLFSKAPLPSEGMSFDYPKFDSTTGDVDEQANQGDDLAYIKLKITQANAPIKTYGGYSSMSRQTIERASNAYLSKVLDYQKISYGKRTNLAVRNLLVNGTAGAITGDNISANNTDAGAWSQATIDAVAKIDDQSVGLQAEFGLMGLHHFKIVAGIKDTTGRPIFGRGDGVNTFGRLNNAVTIPGLWVEIEGLPWWVDPSLTGSTGYVCSSDAITVMESAGAPFRLEDENIINLTKDFSLYGYMATTLNDAKGIAKINVGTTPAAPVEG